MAFKSFTSASSDETKSANSFDTLKQANNTEGKTDNHLTTGNNSKLKALNFQFKTKVNDVISSKPLTDLRPLFAKYEIYIKNILQASDKSSENPKETVQENGDKPAKVEDDRKSSCLLYTSRCV